MGYLIAIALTALASCVVATGPAPHGAWRIVFSVNHSYTEPGSESSKQTTIRAESSGALTLHSKHSWRDNPRIDSCTVSAVLDSPARTRLAALSARAVASHPQRSYNGFEASDLETRASFFVSSGAASCTTMVSGIGAHPPALDSLASVLDSLSRTILTGCPK